MDAIEHGEDGTYWLGKQNLLNYDAAKKILNTRHLMETFLSLYIKAMMASSGWERIILSVVIIKKQKNLRIIHILLLPIMNLFG